MMTFPIYGKNKNCSKPPTSRSLTLYPSVLKRGDLWKIMHVYVFLYLVGGIPTPLKNMSSSDWIIIPTIGENKKNLPNHQPDIIWANYNISLT